MQGWLEDVPARLFLSQQLRAVGRLVLQEIRASHFPPGFARLIMRALRFPRKLLSNPIMRGELLTGQDLWLWPVLTLLIAASACGIQTNRSFATLSPLFWRRARMVAAASEFLGAAIDIIDDIQDGDSPFVQQIGIPQALNVGAALLELAPLTLNQARAAGWPNAIADAAIEQIHIGTLQVLSGQFLDLRFEHTRAVTEAQVIEMTGQKSGSLVALMCRLGAMAGTATAQESSFDYIEATSQFGWHLGIWAQLLNDFHDAEPDHAPKGKSDRQRGKKTLPLLLEQRGMIEGARQSQREAAALNTQAALSYTFVAAETFRLRTQKILQALEERFGPHPLLWPFLNANWEEG